MTARRQRAGADRRDTDIQVARLDEWAAGHEKQCEERQKIIISNQTATDQKIGAVVEKLDKIKTSTARLTAMVSVGGYVLVEIAKKILGA